MKPEDKQLLIDFVTALREFKIATTRLNSVWAMLDRVGETTK